MKLPKLNPDLVVCGLIALVVFAFWIQNIDYQPQFEKIQIGMTEKEVAEILGEIRIEKGIWEPGVDCWFFQEPDAFPSYFFNVLFRDGRVIRKYSDL